MHSSRMRTGRSLTVSGGSQIFGGGASQKKFWGTPHAPPPEKLRPPRKLFETPTPPKISDPSGPGTPTPQVDRQTPVNMD